MIVDRSSKAVRWSLPLLKVHPGQRVLCRLEGGQWFFFGSHWVERAYLCPGDPCEGCVYGSPRVMGYRVALCETPSRLQPVLLEAPLTSVARFENLCQLEGCRAVRGVRFSLSRKHRRAGVALEPEEAAGAGDAAALEDSHTLNAVAVIFRLPELMPGEEAKAWASRVQCVARARLAAAVAKAR